jgi:hypothetical protein
MELTEMTIHYQGFHPTDFTKGYLEEMMDELYTESPHGSFFQAVFSRQNHIFKARIRIDAANGHFFAVASGRKLKEVTHRVVIQIRKQFGKWKSLRFHKRNARELSRELNRKMVSGFNRDENNSETRFDYPDSKDAFSANAS